MLPCAKKDLIQDALCGAFSMAASCLTGGYMGAFARFIKIMPNNVAYVIGSAMGSLLGIGCQQTLPKDPNAY